MELVPGGTYVWGNRGAVSEIQVADFYMSLYPVTNAQYRKFLQNNESTLKQEPWFNDSERNQYQDLPDDHWVRGISYDSANAYCKWTRTRLLTLFELEYFVFQTQSSSRIVFGINGGYRHNPFYWTSTKGREIGKDNGEAANSQVIAPVDLGMNRGTSFPVIGGYGVPDSGFRCAASLDMVKDILLVQP